MLEWIATGSLLLLALTVSARGYTQARFEIIGAFGNACFLVAMSFLMMIEAVQRLLEKSGTRI